MYLLQTLAGYLNAGSVPDHFYIAAHGVVNYNSTGGSGTCPTLQDGLYRYLKSVPGVNYYGENMRLYDQADTNSTLSIYFKWLVC